MYPVIILKFPIKKVQTTSWYQNSEYVDPDNTDTIFFYNWGKIWMVKFFCPKPRINYPGPVSWGKQEVVVRFDISLTTTICLVVFSYNQRFEIVHSKIPQRNSSWFWNRCSIIVISLNCYEIICLFLGLLLYFLFF